MRVNDLTGRALVDTNVLIYATLTADPRHERAKAVLALRQRKGVELFISVQSLAEMYPNLTGPKNQPPDTPTVARDKIRALSRLRGLTVLPLTVGTVQSALEMCVKCGVTRQSYFDSQLAATMLGENISVIFTENTKNFSDIAGITPLNPFA